MICYIFKDTPNNPILLQKIKLVPTTKKEIDEILKENHDSKLAGHPGLTKTYNRIKERYEWNSMKKDIKEYIKKCDSCKLNKVNTKPLKSSMQITTSTEPFERLAIDIVGPLPLTINGNKFILTMQDDLTKYSYATPIPNHESRTVALELTKFITLFGIPKSILTDQGSDFMSNLIKDLTKLLNIKHFSSSPYHPQTNGALERSHLTLKDYIKHYINAQQANWDEQIPFAMFACNTNIHTSTGYSPFEILFGRKPYLPSKLTQEPEISYSYDDFVEDLKQRLQYTQKVARERIVASKTKTKQHYDKQSNPHMYSVGDKVLIKNSSTKLGTSKKLAPRYSGPYKIIKTADSESCEATLLAKVVTQIANNCEIHTVPAIMEAWHELYNKGWLFALTEPTIVTFSCSESRIIDIELASTGEIHFAEDCRCYTKHRVIKGRKNINMTQPSLSRTPVYNLANDECCIDYGQFINISDVVQKPLKLSNVNFDELKYVNFRFAGLNKILYEHLNKKSAITSNYWTAHIWSVVSTIFGATLLFVTWKLFRTIKWRQLFRSTDRCGGCCIRIYNDNRVHPNVRTSPHPSNHIELDDCSASRSNRFLSVNMD
ncbi:UNVERIFIED_CONTAM: hypothetical protein PYX00_010797 [Menopon gallinae]|uniref:RNA-directed DNA polymerase n=1 Tax=Menopon gallinae TaxID=328185 RepID=A0AAW2HH83_9NEOP